MSLYYVSVTFRVDAADEDAAWDEVDHAIGSVPPTVAIVDVETDGGGR